MEGAWSCATVSAMNVVSIETIRTQREERWQEAREIAEEYLSYLISLGWGMYRIGEAHGIEPWYPAGKGRLLNGKEAEGIWSQEYMIDCLADYIFEDGELLG